ncbi:MAG: acyl carrier protein [Bacteroidota bacterium]|jgi:acyl carrier protein
MEKKIFVEKFREALEIKSLNLDENTPLNSIDGYDSMSVMAIIALVDELFSKRLTAKQLAQVSNIKSLMELIGFENFS